MAVVSKLISIGLIVVSFAIGIIIFYIMSELSEEEKKAYISEITSQLINLVLFIWLAKIVLNFSVFIADPLTILAYPSDSTAFYLAIGLTTVWFFITSIRKKKEILPLIESFVPIFLVSSFVYEFIQYVIYQHRYSFGYLILLGMLILLYYLVKTRYSFLLYVAIWSIGMIILAIVQPYVTVFGYMMAPWFIGSLFLAILFIYIYEQRRRM